MLAGEEHKEYLHERIFKDKPGDSLRWNKTTYELFAWIAVSAKERSIVDPSKSLDKEVVENLQELLGITFSGEIYQLFVIFVKDKNFEFFEKLCSAIDNSLENRRQIKKLMAWAPYAIIWKKRMVDFINKIITDPVGIITKIDIILSDKNINRFYCVPNKLLAFRKLIQEDLQNGFSSK